MFSLVLGLQYVNAAYQQSSWLRQWVCSNKSRELVPLISLYVGDGATETGDAILLIWQLRNDSVLTTLL